MFLLNFLRRLRRKAAAPEIASGAPQGATLNRAAHAPAETVCALFVLIETTGIFIGHTGDEVSHGHHTEIAAAAGT